MNQGKYVFAQIGSFLPQRAFDTIVSRYNGDYRAIFLKQKTGVHIGKLINGISQQCFANFHQYKT
jgi:hypothetical protein